MQKNDVALRKRQQIAQANRTMFLGVAAASAVVGAAFVLSFVLFQKLVFNEKVLIEKNNTAGTLQKNNQEAETLKENVRVLNTNQALVDLQTNGDNEPAQVVLDALPSTVNSAALGASLQSNQLLSQPGITIESLTVSPVAGVEDNGDQTGDATSTNGTNTIQFSFTVSTSSHNAGALKDLLKRLERSIRTINILQLDVQTQGSKLVMTASGEAYYEPAKTVQLQDKVVKP